MGKKDRKKEITKVSVVPGEKMGEKEKEREGLKSFCFTFRNCRILNACEFLTHTHLHA